MRDCDNLNTLFLALNLSEDVPTRSAAKKAKPANLHVCLVCDTAFASSGSFAKHLKKVHRAVAKEVNTKYRNAKKAYEANPGCPAAVYNYKRALARVTFLEKYH